MVDPQQVLLTLRFPWAQTPEQWSGSDCVKSSAGWELTDAHIGSGSGSPGRGAAGAEGFLLCRVLAGTAELGEMMR